MLINNPDMQQRDNCGSPTVLCCDKKKSTAGWLYMYTRRLPKPALIVRFSTRHVSRPDKESRSLYDIWVASGKIPANDTWVLTTADDASGIELQLENSRNGLLSSKGLGICICIPRSVCVSIVIVVVMMMMVMVVMMGLGRRRLGLRRLRLRRLLHWLLRSNQSRSSSHLRVIRSCVCLCLLSSLRNCSLHDILGMRLQLVHGLLCTRCHPGWP
jgi:hypothetical protein